MSADDPSGARSTRLPVLSRHVPRQLYTLVEAQQPMNVRHAFYLGTVARLVNKTDSGTGTSATPIQWDLTARCD